MINDSNFTFNVSISVDSYVDKKDASESIATLKLAKKNGHTKKMSFFEETLTLDQFEGKILSGHSYCGGIFRFPDDYTETFTTQKGGKYTTSPFYSDGSLKVQFKADRYFTYGQVISIDVDGTRFNDPELYVSHLTLQPSFVYTSSSDNPDGLRKFRVVYVFSMPLNKDGYELATKAIHKQAEQDTIEMVKDSCGERFSQAFIGNPKAQTWKTYNILEPGDLKPIIDKYGIECDERPEDEVSLFSKELINAMETLDYKTFMHYNSLKYEYFWNNLSFCEGEEYRKIDPSRDVVLLFRWSGKFSDGESRRKRLQKYAALRRIAKPWITPDELLFNLYVDRERFFDNSDGALTLDCLKRKVEIAFKKTPLELRKDYSYILENCPYKFVVNPKYWYRAHEIINRASKELRWAEIDKVYDLGKSVKENLLALEESGIKIKKTALYDYCKARGIETKPGKESRDKKVLELYNPSLSQRENIRLLEENGIKISKTSLTRILGSGSSSKEETETGCSICCMASNIIIAETEKVDHSEKEGIFYPSFQLPGFSFAI